MTGIVSAPIGSLSGVRDAGVLRAAVSQGIPGLSHACPDGRWSGMDADFARVVAAATVGDGDAVEWHPTAPGDRLEVVRTGRADLGVCNTSRTLTREIEVLFGEILCHDGEGFLVHASLGIDRASKLAGRTLAVQAGTTTLDNLARWKAAGGPAVRALPYDTPEAALRSYLSGESDGYVLDTTALAGIRANCSDPSAHILLADTISDEPMTPFVARDAIELLVLIRWCHHLLVAAEAAEVTGVPLPIARIDDLGPSLGVDAGWASRALAVAGHYGDIFAANLGANSPLNLPRGHNALWLDGGQHYPPPLR